MGWFTEATAHWPEQDRAGPGRLLRRLATEVTGRPAAPDSDQGRP